MQSAAATYLLWQDSYKHKTERYLWLFVAMLSLHMAIKFVLLVVLKDERLFDDFSTSISLIYGPLLFFYVQTIRKGSPLSRATHWLHLTPFILFTVLYAVVGVHVFSTKDYSWLVFHKAATRYGEFASTITYSPYLLYNMHRERAQYPQLQWLLNLLWISTIVGIYFFITFLLRSEIAFMAKPVIFILVIILTLAILRHFIKTKVIYIEDSMVKIKALSPGVKYQKSGLTEAQMQEYTVALQAAMERDKLYLNPDLSLTDLATRLNTSNHHLTEVLNIHLEKNFFQFVNEYRIEEAKRKITKSPNENLFILASACGFNSKTTFIKYFKQIEGITPSQYSDNQKSGNDRYNKSA